MENILQEAERLTSKDRRDDYGAIELIACTAEMISGYLRGVYLKKILCEDLDSGESSMMGLKDLLKNGFFDITAKEFCQLMCVVKISRENVKHKKDNLSDEAGYARLISIAEGDEEVNPLQK